MSYLVATQDGRRVLLRCPRLTVWDGEADMLTHAMTATSARGYAAQLEAEAAKLGPLGRDVRVVIEADGVRCTHYLVPAGARALARQLAQLADELEQKVAPERGAWHATG